MNVTEHHTVEQLHTLYRTTTNARLARRIQAVWLARRGRTCPEIMEITGASRRAVQQWIARYNDGGIEALPDKPRSGRPAFLDTDQRQRLARRIECGPTPEDPGCVFTGPIVGDLIEREFGVLYSLRGVQRLLGRLNFSYLAPRPTHEKANPEAQAAFKKSSRTPWRKSPPPIPADE